MKYLKEGRKLLTKEDVEYIEQYKETHPAKNGAWIDNALNEIISEDDLLLLVENVPVIKDHTIYLSDYETVDYKTPKDHLKQFLTLLEEAVIIGEVICISRNNQRFYYKGDIIYWIEQKGRASKEFYYSLVKEFVEDYKCRHPRFEIEWRERHNILIEEQLPIGLDKRNIGNTTLEKMCRGKINQLHKTNENLKREQRKKDIKLKKLQEQSEDSKQKFFSYIAIV